MPNLYKFNKKRDFFKDTYNLLFFIPKSKTQIIYNNNFIIWEYKYISTGSEIYTLCLNYERFWPPRVWIVEPDLTKIYMPHVYKQNGNSLCLYHKRDFQWSKDKNIIQTIICWSCLWIEYYEIYKILGKWVGPEAEHETVAKILLDTKEITLSSQSGHNSQSDAKQKEDKPLYLKDYPIRIRR
jgi:hypothetical protein